MFFAKEALIVQRYCSSYIFTKIQSKCTKLRTMMHSQSARTINVPVTKKISFVDETTGGLKRVRLKRDWIIIWIRTHDIKKYSRKRSNEKNIRMRR